MITSQQLMAAHAAVLREDWTQAWLINNAILNQDPDRPEALFLMGSCLRQMGNMGLALTCLTKALAREQKHPNLWMAYGATLHDLNRWDEAIEAFSVANKMMPGGDAMAMANIAAAYVQQGKNRESINQADKALKLDPTNYIAKIAKTFGSLALGRWKDGWENAEYLYGYHLPERIYRDKGNEEPQWDGTTGKTVVVECDQGLGDQIMFAQCLPQLKRDCKEVILECSERMVSFFRRNFPGVSVYGTLKQPGLEWPKHHAIDAHIHISYLGKFYRNLDSDFPRRQYVVACPRRRNAWLEWLEKFPKPWTGIAWKGGIQATNAHLRSVDLEELEAVINRGGTVFDLSYQDTKAEVSRWNLDNVNQVIVPPIDTADYEDTVALADCLDEVVCVTTTIFHVRGALGRTVRVLVPSVAQWREAHMLGDGTSMIWYPETSVKFYRQKPGEKTFEHAIKRLVEDM